MEIREVFRYTITCLELTALKRPRFKDTDRKRHLKNVLFYVVWIFYHGCVSMNLVKYSFLLDRERRNYERIVPITALFLCHVGYSYMSFMSYYAITKHLDNFFDVIDKYQKSYGKLKKYDLVHKSNKLLPMSVIGNSINASFFIVFIVYYWREHLSIIAYPFDFSDFENISLLMITMFLNEAAIIAHQTIFSFLLGTCYIIFIYEFGRLSKSIGELIQKFNDDKEKNAQEFESKIEAYRKQHVTLIECLEVSNSLIGHVLFGSYAVFIPVSCFLLYGAVRQVLSTGELLFISSASSSLVVYVLIVTATGPILNSKIHEPLDELMQIDLSSVTDKTSQSVNLFAVRLIGPSIGFRVHGLLTVTSGTILSVLGSLLTYAIVMLQFSESSYDTFPDVTNNFTNISSS